MENASALSPASTMVPSTVATAIANLVAGTSARAGIWLLTEPVLARAGRNRRQHADTRSTPVKPGAAQTDMCFSCRTGYRWLNP